MSAGLATQRLLILAISTLVFFLTMVIIFGGIVNVDTSEFTESSVERNLQGFRSEIEPGCSVGGTHSTDVQQYQFSGKISTVEIAGDTYRAEYGEEDETVTIPIQDCDSVTICQSGQPGDDVDMSCSSGSFEGGQQNYKAKYDGANVAIMPVVTN